MEGFLPYTSEYNKNGFRLLLVEIQNHHVLARNGNRCRLIFYESDPEATISVGKKPYSTVIIGPNGVGKSFVLSAIADIFRHLKKIQDGKGEMLDKLDFRFAIEYFLNGHHFRISNLYDDKVELVPEKIFYYCWTDGNPTSFSNCILPPAILASSITISDRFKTQRQQDGFYWYLGARNENSPSTTGTKTIVRKTVAAIAECLSHEGYFKQQLLDLLGDLGLERRMEIEYAIRYRKVYLAEPITEERFVRAFENWGDAFKEAGSKRESAPWGQRKFSGIKKNPENISRIVKYLNEITANGQITRAGHIVYNIEEESFVEDWKAIQLLSELDILSYPKIRVFKREKKLSHVQSFLFEESSSGETSMLCQFINILSRIEQHSLVLIDEPEACAHPNWQIHYIDWLNAIFKRFHTCHFVISTHSHFLLSDLEKGTSAIVALDRDRETGVITNLAEGVNTYGWSTDDILYEVFRIRNTKNEALERDLERAIQLMEEKGVPQEGEIEALLTRFNNVYRGVRDPLGKFIEELEKYAKSRS